MCESQSVWVHNIHNRVLQVFWHIAFPYCCQQWQYTNWLFPRLRHRQLWELPSRYLENPYWSCIWQSQVRLGSPTSGYLSFNSVHKQKKRGELYTVVHSTYRGSCIAYQSWTDNVRAHADMNIHYRVSPLKHDFLDGFPHDVFSTGFDIITPEDIYRC